MSHQAEEYPLGASPNFILTQGGTMSDFDLHPEDPRGQSDGSRRSRFSSDNQPSRRRQRAPRKNLKASLLAQMRQPVKITIGGKVKTVEYFEALLQSLSKDLLSAKVSEKLRYFEKLDKFGLTGRLADQAKLDDERAEFEQDRRDFAQLERNRRLVREDQDSMASQQKLQWYAAAKILTQFRQSCNCSAFSGKLAQDTETLCHTFVLDEADDRLSEEMLIYLRQEMTETLEDFDDDWES